MLVTRFVANLANCLASYVVFLDFRRCFTHNAIPLILAALIAAGIIVIGCFYLVSPERILGTFGLKMRIGQMLMPGGIPLIQCQ